MTDYLDLFTAVVRDGYGALYHWDGWQIDWDMPTQRGELYNPDGLFVTAGDDLEALAAEAVRQEEGGAS